MSEVKKEEVKPVLPVTGLFGDLSAGVDLTPEVIANKLITVGEHLPLITRIKDPIALSIIDMLSKDADAEGYKSVGDIYRSFLKAYRENCCSEGGWRSEQIKEMMVADMERIKRESERLGERLVGKERR